MSENQPSADDSLLPTRLNDIYLHSPPKGTSVIPRDVRRRATSNVKQPHYFNKNNPKNNKRKNIEQIRYLELHNWNAKRMHMRSMWGWMLPYSNHQHPPNTSLKLISKKACIHDNSYHEVVRVSGNYTCICQLIDTISLHTSSLSERCINCIEIQTITVYSQQETKSICIGPIQVIAEKQSPQLSSSQLTLLLFCHPSIIDSIMLVLTQSIDSTCNITKDDSLCLFSIKGSQSYQVLHSLYPCLHASEETLQNNHIYPLYYECQPRIIPYYAPEYYSMGEGNQLRIPHQVYIPPTEKRTGQKSIPISSSLKQAFIEVQKTHLVISWITNQSSSCSSYPILVIRKEQSQFGKNMNGYDIIVPRVAVKWFWQSMCDKKLKCMSQTDWHAIHTCYGIPLFPYDYPETPAGMLSCTQSYANPYAMITLQPSDYYLAKNAIITTITAALQDQSSMQSLFVAIKRNQIEIKQYRSNPNLNEPCLIPVHIKIIKKGSIHLPCAIREPTAIDLSHVNETVFIPANINPIIGFMTSAIWSPKASAYVGIGYCAANLLYKCIQKQGTQSQCITLLSNETPVSACFARLTVADN